jgi:hypothetical protein
MVDPRAAAHKLVLLGCWAMARLCLYPLLAIGDNLNRYFRELLP